MRTYSLTHLSDAVLLRDLAALIGHDRATTAEILVHIAEVDARRLYAPAGYPSMHAYCVGELRLSEDAAFKRIRAARAGREFPTLFAALVEGRLHLAAVWVLAPHLTRENVDELIEVATHRCKSDIEEMLAQRFLHSEGGASLRAVPAMACELQLAPGRVGSAAVVSTGNLDGPSPGNGNTTRVEPVPSSEHFLLKLTIGKRTREKLRYAQCLLSHAVPSGDVAQVLDRALDALIVELEKRKLGAGTRQRPRLGTGTRRQTLQHSEPRVPTRPSPIARSRYIPARVRRAVWDRDQGRCTFVSSSGHRCESRRFLEFDHIDPVARGGRATVEGMRLRCRAHNQYEAERTFGAGFMTQKRYEARLAAAEIRARVARKVPRGTLGMIDVTTAAAERNATQSAAREHAAQEEEARGQIRDVLAGLRSLGCRADEARRAAALSGTLQGVTLEERMRAALKSLGRG